jgi:hypothetical protein
VHVFQVGEHLRENLGQLLPVLRGSCPRAVFLFEGGPIDLFLELEIAVFAIHIGPEFVEDAADFLRCPMELGRLKDHWGAAEWFAGRIANSAPQRC